MLLPILMGQHLVASGSIAAGDNKLDYTATNAFIEFGVDLTSYHGNHKIVVTDSAGKSASGFLHSVAPGGETLGANGLNNPTFDSNTNYWNMGLSTLASVAGGQSNNCLEVTRVSGTYQFARQATWATIPANSSHKLYKYGGYVKSGTSNNEAFQLGLTYYRPGDPAILGTSSGDWVAYSAYYTMGTPTYLFFDCNKYSETAGTMLFDEVFWKQVTDCAATGALIVSTLGGSTRSWTSVDTGFNPNLACTYKIYRVR
ncbi:MAG: hypothetical protein WC261_10525 [Synergistaceae bacterium]|jgi:hypothetical protein